MDPRPAYTRYREQIRDDRIQDEARIANDLQRDNPDISRDEALRLAADEGHVCRECGAPMFITAAGIAHHGEDEDSIDHDADGDHVALSEVES